MAECSLAVQFQMRSDFFSHESELRLKRSTVTFFVGLAAIGGAFR